MIGIVIALTIMAINMLCHAYGCVLNVKNGISIYDYSIKMFSVLSNNSGHMQNPVTETTRVVKNFRDAKYVYCMPNPDGLLVALVYEDEVVP